MLKDRRVLLEQEIKKAHDEASAMYLSIVIHNNGDMNSPGYQALKDRIANLQFDLDVVNRLIGNGHQ